jgi:hypothetical protein
MMELDHFLDDNCIKRIELELLGSMIKQEWDLPDEFRIADNHLSYNKEPSLIIQELTEKIWRHSAPFDANEVTVLTDMFLIKRGKDSFDREFSDQDKDSL